MKIALLGNEGIFLIIADENSPAFYKQQAGGYSYVHPEMRGVLVPLEFQPEIRDKFINLKYMGSGWALDSEEFHADLPTILEQLSDYFDEQYVFQLDNDKKSKNIESWVHLTGIRSASAKEEEHEIFSACRFAGLPEQFHAILTWPNSD